MNKRSPLLLLIPAILLGFSTTLSADKPLRLMDSNTFVDLDPCTDQLHTITLYFDTRLHFHRNNFLAEVKRSGTTDSGYRMVGAHETFVVNFAAGQLKGNFVDNWRSDDGRVWQVGSIFVLDLESGEVRVDKGAFRCLKG